MAHRDLSTTTRKVEHPHGREFAGPDLPPCQAPESHILSICVPSGVSVFPA